MVGQITSVAGVVEVIDGRGQHHRLGVGDWLREGDRLVTTPGSAVQVATTAGSHFSVSEPQTLTMRAELVAEETVDRSEDAVHPRLLQYVLATIQAEHAAHDLSALLNGLQDEAGFSVFAAELEHPVSDQTVALNINDLIMDAAQAGSHVPAETHSHALSLLAQSGLPSEMALQQGLLKDYLKDV